MEAKLFLLSFERNKSNKNSSHLKDLLAEYIKKHVSGLSNHDVRDLSCLFAEKVRAGIWSVSTVVDLILGLWNRDSRAAAARWLLFRVELSQCV